MTNAGGMKKIAIDDYYLVLEMILTRYGHTYYGKRIGNHTILYYYIMQCQVTGKRYKIELYLQWQTNRKSYRTFIFNDLELNDP